MVNKITKSPTNKLPAKNVTSPAEPHKRGPKRRSSTTVWLEKTIKLRLKERNLIDVLCSSHHYSGWTHEFRPLSGNAAKIKNYIERYVLTTFAYATGM